MLELSPFDRGFLLGVLIGEGSFGGDGKQPQVTVRMHTRHENLFRWLETTVPGSRLYGPYHHGGRSYYQWMVRGQVLVDELIPVLQADLSADLDEHAAKRFADMCENYSTFIGASRARSRARLTREPATRQDT
jgi:hypothetical protein